MTASRQKVRGASDQDTEETWDVLKGAVAREEAGPAVHKEDFVVLRLTVEMSHLVCVPLPASQLGETRSLKEEESGVLQDEKC